MWKTLLAGALALVISGVVAGPLEDGEAAYMSGDYASAMQLLRPLAEAGKTAYAYGNPWAQFEIGLMYDNGEGVPQDYAQAAFWYSKAADQGLVSAQFNLGLIYYMGRGVLQDYGQAAVWFQKAAEQGDASAQLNLGLMFDKGDGVPQDYELGYMWENIAAARAKDPGTQNKAAKNRDKLAAKMTPAQIEEAQRMAREWVSKRPPNL
jgi:uncharacterized protein